MKRKITFTVAALMLLCFTGLAIHGVQNNQQNIHKSNIELESKNFKLQKIEIEYRKLNQELEQERGKKDVNQQRIQELEQKVKEQDEQYKALQVSKAAEKAEQQRLAQASQKAVNAVTGTATASAQAPSGGVVDGCGDNEYAHYIYMHESGCNTGAVNAGGCRGIGQACPGSKLPCGADYACQNAYFTNYALSRYGSWQAAYNFWVANHWW